MNKEQYVTFEIAKLLKEKGFNIPSDTSYEDCLWEMYDEDGNVHWGMYSSDWYFRITMQMACDWLMTEKHIFIGKSFVKDKETLDFVFQSPIFNMDTGELITTICAFCPEDAVEAALQYCLKNII